MQSTTGAFEIPRMVAMCESCIAAMKQRAFDSV